LKEMSASITDIGIRSIIWYSNKFMRVGLSGLHVNEKSINRVKQLISPQNRIVFIPIYKSYADFFILSYVFHHYDIELPYTFGN